MARQTLPTAADVLGLSSSDRAAVGGWTEKETAGTVGQAARRLRMSLRYSGIGATSALVVKAHIIQVLSRMREQGAPTSAAWDHVAVLFPRLLGLRELQKDNVLTSRQLATPTEQLVPVSSSASSVVGPTSPACFSPSLLDVFRWFHGPHASALVHLLKRDAAWCTTRPSSLSTFGSGAASVIASGCVLCVWCHELASARLPGA